MGNFSTSECEPVWIQEECTTRYTMKGREEKEKRTVSKDQILNYAIEGLEKLKDSQFDIKRIEIETVREKEGVDEFIVQERTKRTSKKKRGKRKGKSHEKESRSPDRAPGHTRPEPLGEEMFASKPIHGEETREEYVQNVLFSEEEIWKAEIESVVFGGTVTTAEEMWKEIEKEPMRYLTEKEKKRIKNLPQTIKSLAGTSESIWKTVDCMNEELLLRKDESALRSVQLEARRKSEMSFKQSKEDKKKRKKQLYKRRASCK